MSYYSDRKAGCRLFNDKMLALLSGIYTLVSGLSGKLISYLVEGIDRLLAPALKVSFALIIKKG